MTQDYINAARNAVENVGGVNGNGVDEWTPLACSYALIAIAEELRQMNDRQAKAIRLKH